jgi:hypothetical protein
MLGGSTCGTVVQGIVLLRIIIIIIIILYIKGRAIFLKNWHLPNRICVIFS